MLARIRKSMQERDQGFTLIELLVVMIIIGILAAIAIPTFLNQRENAWVSAVESDLRNAAVAAESFAVENGGTYTGLGAEGVLEDNGYNQTQGVTEITVTVGTPPTTYTLTAGHDNLGARTWTYDSAAGVIDEN